MSRKISKTGKPPQPDWKTKWPRIGDLARWFRYMLQKRDAISDDKSATDWPHLPIEHLAELGHEAEAIRWVNRFLRRLRREKVLRTVRMAKLCAKISLDARNLKRMEKYLAIAESTWRLPLPQ